MIAKMIEDKKWEYLKVGASHFEDLDGYGYDGWELVCMSKEFTYPNNTPVYYFILKRSYTEKIISEE